MSWGAVIIGGSALVGGYMASQSSKKASQSQSEAATSAASAQVYAADKAYEASMAGIKSQETMTAPWRETGGRALNTLEGMTRQGPGKFETSPGYQFRLSEGNRGIQSMAAARGGLLSGATGKALTRYGQDYATQDYDSFLSRYYDTLKPYQSLAGLGQTSANQTAATVGQGYGNAAQAITQGGAAQAAGYLGQGNAAASNYLTQGNVWSNTLNQGMGAYTLWKMGQTQNTGYQSPYAMGSGTTNDYTAWSAY